MKIVFREPYGATFGGCIRRAVLLDISGLSFWIRSNTLRLGAHDKCGGKTFSRV